MYLVKKNSLARKVWTTLTDPEVVVVNASLSGLAICCGFAMSLGGVLGYLSAGVLAFALSLMGYLLYQGVVTNDSHQAMAMQLQAQQWARQAPTEAEREERRSSIDSFGPEAAMGAAIGGGTEWIGPAFNIDGTPMLEGGLDARGHAFSQTDAPELQFDELPPGADSFSGYEPPIGSDH